MLILYWCTWYFHQDRSCVGPKKSFHIPKEDKNHANVFMDYSRIKLEVNNNKISHTPKYLGIKELLHNS